MFTKEMFKHIGLAVIYADSQSLKDQQFLLFSILQSDLLITEWIVQRN